MKHEHFKKIDSTQKYLIDLIQNKKNIDVVTSLSQTKGKGRGKNIWDSYKDSLLFSFVIAPSKKLSLTSLEISIHIINYFQAFLNINDLKLKWPNDILNEKGKKCAGIIVNIINDKAVVGIGINLGKNKFNDSAYKTRASYLTEKNYTEKEKIAHMISLFQYISNNRISNKEILFKWTQSCFHLEKLVSITDDTTHTGVFKKLGPFGEAYLELQNGKSIKLLNGTLTIQ